MIFSSDSWLIWASKFIPENRRDWLAAMRAEYISLDDPDARRQFARGCFKAVLVEWVQSRHGLNLLGRAGGSICLILLAVFGFLSARKMGLDPERELSGYAGIISTVCVAYLGAGIMLLLSVRATKYFAAGGFFMAMASLLWFQISQPVMDGVSAKFLSAISLETSGLMAALFMACLYLGWLYDPDRFAV